MTKIGWQFPIWPFCYLTIRLYFCITGQKNSRPFVQGYCCKQTGNVQIFQRNRECTYTERLSSAHMKTLSGELSTCSHHLQYSAHAIEMASASTLKLNEDKRHQAEYTCKSHVHSAYSCISAWESPSKAQEP